MSLFLSCLCYSAEHLTDGHITHTAIGTMRQQAWNPGKVAEALADAGLLERLDDGFRIHHYHDYNPSSEAVKEKRVKDLARKRGLFQSDSEKNPRGILSAHARAGAGDGNGSDGSFDSEGVQGETDPKDHPIRELLGEYFELFEQKTGVKADLIRGKDTGILRQLVDKHGLERCRENLRTMFETSDEFICRSGYTIGILKACFNKLSVLSRTPVTSAALSKRTQGNLEAAARFIQRGKL